MDFTFTEDQEMFRNTAKKFFTNECPMNMVRNLIRGDGYSVDLWKKIAEMGFLGMLISEEYGGMGGAFMDLCPILEEMGRSLFPSPFIPTAIIGSSIISEEADDETKEKILPSIISGDTTMTWAVDESGEEIAKDSIKTKLDISGNDYIIEGVKLFVPFAGQCNYIICAVQDKTLDEKGITLLLVDTKTDGLTLTPIPSFSLEKYYKVRFERVKIPKRNVIGTPGKGWETIERLRLKTTAAQCLVIVGGLMRVLEMTVRFVKEREQFGRPIGSFQSIQNYCADIAIDVEASKYIAYQAAWKVSNNLPCKAEVSMAKAWCGDAYQRATAIALQAHGAMGFTEEYDLHLFYKQAKSLQLMYGGSTFHRKIVAEEMGL